MTRNNGESRSTTAGPPPRCRSHSWALNATMRTRSVTLVTSWWVVGLWGALGVATGALSLVALLHPAWYVRYSYIYAQEAEAVSFQVMVSSVGPLGFCRLESVDTSQKPSSDSSEDDTDETQTTTTLQADTTTTTITTPLVETTKKTTPFIDTTTTTTRQPYTTTTTTRRTTTTTTITITPRKTEKDPTTDWPLGNTTPPELTHKYTTHKGTRLKEFLPIHTTPSKLGIPEPTAAPGYPEEEKHGNSTAFSIALGSENSPQPTEAHSSNAPIPEQVIHAIPTSKHTIKAHTQPRDPTHTGANSNQTGQEFVTRVPENQESYYEPTQPYSVAESKTPQYPSTKVSPSFTTPLPNRLEQDRHRTTPSAELTTNQTGRGDVEGTDGDGRDWESKSIDKGVTDGFRDVNKILYSSTPSSAEEEEEKEEEEGEARGNVTDGGLTEPEISGKRGQQEKTMEENGVGNGRRRQGSGGNVPGERMMERGKMERRGEERGKAQVNADDKGRGRGERRKKVHEERPAGTEKSERRGGKERGEVLERENEERKEAKERRKNGREQLPNQRRIGPGESEKGGGDRESKLEEDGSDRKNEERRKLPEEEQTEHGKEPETERELETSNETERRKEERRKEVPKEKVSERKEEEGDLERGGEREGMSETKERKLNSRRRFNTLGVGPGERRRGGEGGGRGGGGGSRKGRRRKKKRGRKRKKWKNRRGNDSRTHESRTEHNGERERLAQDGKTQKSKTEHTHSRETERLTRGDGRRTHELRREHTHNGENGRLGRRKSSRTHELKTEHTSNGETEKLAREDSRAHESRTEHNRGTERQAKRVNRTHESKTEHSEETERLGTEEEMERLYRGILSDKRFKRNVRSSTEMQMESEAQQQDAVQNESYNPRPPILRCSGVGGGVGAGSSSVWALVGVVYGVAGVVQACVGVGALSLPLTHTQARRYWIALWLGNVQVAVVMSQAVALVLFPLGLGSSLARGECGGSSSVYWPGECTFGWSYMLAVVATILAAYCPCLARLTVFRRLAFREWDSLNFF